MSNLLSIRINAILLVAILVAGTLSLIYPSSMTSTQALEMNNNFKKSFGKDSIIKCNNINVNVNGFELGLNSIPEVLGEEVAGAEADTDASSFGSNDGSNNGPSGSDNKGFVFVCINNNNNAGREGNDETEECEICFRTILTEDELAGIIGDFALEGVDSLQDICDFIDENIETEAGRILISETLFKSFNNAEVSSDDFFEVIECLDDVYDVVIPT